MICLINYFLVVHELEAYAQKRSVCCCFTFLLLIIGEQEILEIENKWLK